MHDPDALGARQRRHFITAGRGRSEGYLVVLRTPRGELAVLLDLGAQDAIDARRDRRCSRGTPVGVREIIRRLTGDDIA